VDDGRNYDVIVDGADVTWAIRSPQVETQVSKVSAYEGVRRALTAQQRSIGNRGRVVMVGRDIGTVVMPNAELKIFLDASFEERAKRRYRETLERGLHASYEEILASMRKRDQIDSTRKIAPLVPDREAVIIQSDEMNAQQILDYVLGLIDDDDPL
jgi:cytidylate kinase